MWWMRWRASVQYTVYDVASTGTLCVDRLGRQYIRIPTQAEVMLIVHLLQEVCGGRHLDVMTQVEIESKV